MCILLVEDNESIAEGLVYAFKMNSYCLDYKTTMKDAIEYLNNNTPELIILDVSLPDGNGFNLYEDNIKKSQIPVIFLTARDDEDDIIKGLNLGAEDYMTKPFSTRELLARVNKIILRNKNSSVIKVKDISFDLDKMVVNKNNIKVELSSLELKILHLLFINIGSAVSRNTILEKIWEWTGNDVDDHTITVYLKRIREKLGTDIIITIKGIGYRIDEE
ncbi:response regulators consisting of a CheY-like receiver domain and a winged-helix DNA-binding domain [Clostridium sp. CAG:710]|nr:response regulators consisting of a CheY-like receiver domain and a winged-helix DNA-binding domain [Clostridium sp. CAG:710]